MKFVYLAVGGLLCSCVGGLLVWWLLPVSEVHLPGSYVSWTGRQLFVTYADFVSVLLTTLTIVLGVLAIGVAAAAAYTIRNITVLANKAVDEKVANATKQLETWVAQIAYGANRRLGERDDPNFDDDMEER